MDTRLTDVLVCPVCKGPLFFDHEKSELQCAKCALGFEVKDDIARMIAKDARALSREECDKARIKAAS